MRWVLLVSSTINLIYTLHLGSSDILISHAICLVNFTLLTTHKYTYIYSMHHFHATSCLPMGSYSHHSLLHHIFCNLYYFLLNLPQYNIIVLVLHIVFHAYTTFLLSLIRSKTHDHWSQYKFHHLTHSQSHLYNSLDHFTQCSLISYDLQDIEGFRACIFG